ncbi:MAG: efflux RND transporter permease subunit [Elusimicrobia bacterium]|nr:efflux RND transporter permease subunit [Elusimicrobiota bacterium]
MKHKTVKILALPKFAVEHPVAIAMLYTGLLVLAISAFFRMGLDLFPDVSYPVMSIITTYQGAGTEEVEEKITKMIESQTAIVRHLKEVTSISREGLSVVMLQFEWGTNLDNSANDVRDRLGVIRRQLPTGAEDPVIMRIDMKDIPILIMGVTSSESYSKIYNILDTDVSNMIKRVPGVGNVMVMGGRARQINIDVDRRRLEAYGITLSDVRRAVAANNIMQAAGNIQIGITDYMLRVPGEFNSPQEIADSVVGISRGQAIKIKDVADVRDSHPQETSKVMFNGEPGAVIMVQKRSEANSIAVADGVKKALPEIHKRIPKDIKISPLMDTSQEIRRTLGSLSETLYVAGFLILGVILFFLRRVRPAAIVFTSIPISLLDSFLVQYLAGYTINMISLLALTIAIGLVVDDALVVMENQIRRQEELGEDSKTAAVNATSEVGRAVTVATFTSCVVFLPMLFAGGMAGVMFKPLSIVIIVTLLLSLFDSLTLNPMLSSLFLRAESQTREGRFSRVFHHFDKAFSALENKYKSLISWVLENPKKLVAASASIFLASLLIVPFISSEFMPEEDEGRLQVTLELPVGTRVETTHKVMEKTEEAFRAIIPPEWIKGMFWRDGTNPQSSMGAAMGQKQGSNVGMFAAMLVSKDKRKLSVSQINNKLREKVSKIPGVTRMTFSTGGMTANLMSSTKPMVLNIFGYDLEASYALAERIKNMMEKEIKGFKDVTISLDITRPEYHVVIDRAKAGALGIPVQTIADTVSLAFSQQRSGVYREMGSEYDITIRLRDEDRKSEPDLENLFVRTNAGDTVSLSNLARFEKKPGPLQIDREAQQRIIRVEANIEGNDLGGMTAKLEKRLALIPLPAGISLSMGGSVKEQRESFLSLLFALLIGIMLVYMVMAAQFGSLIIPLIIMFSLPFGFVGAIWVFVLTGYSLSITTFIGVIMMVGLVVKQAVVYLDYALQLVDDKWNIKEALKEAGRVRLRPILMTVSAMVFGFTPMALSTKQGSEFWQPLGLTIIGGLVVSTLVTLVLIPAAYYLIFRNRQAAPTAEPQLK